MFDTGAVVSGPQFAAWIAQQQRRFAPATKLLPPYAKQYFPDPQRQRRMSWSQSAPPSARYGGA